MTQNDIIKACAEAWDVTPDEVLSKCRYQEMVNARHYARFLLHHILGMTSIAIGRLTGCTHGAVLHSYAVVKEWKETKWYENECKRAQYAESILQASA